MTEESETGWLVANRIRWMKAKRPSPERIESYIQGFLGGIGSCKRVGNYWIIILPGRPAYLNVEDGWITRKGDVRRWMRVDLHGEDSVIVRSAVRDSFTNGLANALSRTFYVVQGYEDQEAEEKMLERIVSLKRGSSLGNLRQDSPRLEDFLPTVVDVDIVDTFPTGTTVAIRISAYELKKLQGLIGEKCHIVPRLKGRVDI